jgi:hypothetical protein
MNRHARASSLTGRAMLLFLAGLGLLLGMATRAGAQDPCEGATPPGLAYPVWNWRLSWWGFSIHDPGYKMTEDVVQFTVEDGARLNLGPNEMEIELTSEVSARKELLGYDCQSRVYTGSVFTERSNRGPNTRWRRPARAAAR